jgi:hypothetical protein
LLIKLGAGIPSIRIDGDAVISFEKNCEQDSVVLRYDNPIDTGRATTRMYAGGNMRLDDISWDDIKRIKSPEDASKMFCLGARKPIKFVDGSENILQIIGFGQDITKCGKRANITWDFVHTVGSRAMNEKDTNAGGWSGSDMRDYLNGEFFELLPPDLRGCVVPVVKKTSSGKRSANIADTVDKVWLKSEHEVFGRCIYSFPGEDGWYDFYRQEDVDWAKTDKNGDRVWSWLRSPYKDSSCSFVIVTTGGSTNNNYASLAYGCAPALCT